MMIVVQITVECEPVTWQELILMSDYDNVLLNLYQKLKLKSQTQKESTNQESLLWKYTLFDKAIRPSYFNGNNATTMPRQGKNLQGECHLYHMGNMTAKVFTLNKIGISAHCCLLISAPCICMLCSRIAQFFFHTSDP